MGWFGKKEIVDAVKGVGNFIDEQQLTTEERIGYKLKLFKEMAPFKIIQRIMVTIIMRHWMVWGFSSLISMWVGYLTGDLSYALLNKHIEYASLEMVWVPTASAVALYLGGGLPMFSGRSSHNE